MSSKARSSFALPPELLVPPPENARAVAVALALSFLVFGVIAALAPFQQTVLGTGEVVAYAPDQRQQAVDATISGRVARWFVQEGSEVKAGDPVVELTDNDEDFLSRLDTEKSAADLRLSTQEDRVETLRDRIESLKRSRTAQTLAADADIQVAREELLEAEQKLFGGQAELATAELNFKRQKELKDKGLASTRDWELAELSEKRAIAQVASFEALLRAAKSKLESRTASRARTIALADAEVEAAQATFRDAEGAAAEARARVARVSVDISRQEQQIVRAPRDGIILRVLARTLGEQVSRGEPLALMVPSTSDRAVALSVDGNDAALIHKGKHVRIQFEGWPAVQFSGWPSVAVGTFGGTVSFVDPAGDGKGNFRVVVVPDARDEKWPNPRYLRQGVRAKGWFLLDQVRVGYELWRRFNGFPPTIENPEKALPAGPSKDQGKIEEKK